MFCVYFRHKKNEELRLTLQYKLWQEFADDNYNILFKTYVEEDNSNFEFKNLLNDIILKQIHKVWIPDISTLGKNNILIEYFLLLCETRNIKIYIKNKIIDIKELYDDLILNTVF